MLEVQSNNRGVLFPRVALNSTLDVTTITSPALSLLVFNTNTINDVVPGYNYWDGTKWTALISGGGGSSNPSWELLGNAGTNPVSNYIGTSDAVTLNISTNATKRIEIADTGSMRFYGDFLNQELTGNTVACTTNVSSPAPGGAVASSSLGLPTNIGGVTTRSNSQPLITYNDVASACIIDGTTHSITITDSSGVENSGVLVMGSVSIRTLNLASLPNANRFQIWLQRSNDNFVNNVVNVWKTESAVACGLPTSAPYNMSTGNTSVAIIYPDLNLAPGTYTYRLVFQGGNYGTGGAQSIMKHLTDLWY